MQESDTNVTAETSLGYPRHPKRWCDLIMKGGVTSGVVYPRAVTVLANTYRFKNIGGTSAGAIAASAAAAAELGRQLGRGTHFEEIYKLPDYLKRDNRVFRLFQPQTATRPLFEILTAITDSRSATPWNAVWPAVRGFKRWLIPGLLPGLVAVLGAGAFAGSPRVTGAFLGAFSALSDGSIAAPFAVAEAVLLGLAVIVAYALAVATLLGVAAAALGTAIAVRFLRALPNNMYGLCTGYGDSSDAPSAGPPRHDDNQPLNEWLMFLLDRLAGVPVDSEQPLTFGDLWGIPRDLAGSDRDRLARQKRLDPAERNINLELMTTCISQGRPYKFPFNTLGFFFDSKDMSRLFPPRVVTWMIQHPARLTDAQDDERDEALEARQRQLQARALAEKDGYFPMPEPEDLPVIVAARMSLSVPPLMSAVPLYAVDYSLVVAGAEPRLAKCWFSDGGITSNFPMHFFDSPLPRWPTFGINLRAEHRTVPLSPHGSECDQVHMAQDNKDDVYLPWFPLESVVDFVAAILNTLQNWTDNMQLTQPGFRDRIAHINLRHDEGGFNLNMPEKMIAGLGQRGECAGELLSQRFTAPADDPRIKLTWANHRWVRYRVTMAALQEYFAAFVCGYTDTDSARRGDAASYPALIERPANEPPRYSEFSNAMRPFAVEQTRSVSDTGERWAPPGARFEGDDPPYPRGQLRVTPRL